MGQVFSSWGMTDIAVSPKINHRTFPPVLTRPHRLLARHQQNLEIRLIESGSERLAHMPCTNYTDVKNVCASKHSKSRHKALRWFFFLHFNCTPVCSSHQASHNLLWTTGPLPVVTWVTTILLFFIMLGFVAMGAKKHFKIQMNATSSVIQSNKVKAYSSHRLDFSKSWKKRLVVCVTAVLNTSACVLCKKDHLQK